jgi:hypothetical protein
VSYRWGWTSGNSDATIATMVGPRMAATFLELDMRVVSSA